MSEPDLRQHFKDARDQAADLARQAVLATKQGINALGQGAREGVFGIPGTLLDMTAWTLRKTGLADLDPKGAGSGRHFSGFAEYAARHGRDGRVLYDVDAETDSQAVLRNVSSFGIEVAAPSGLLMKAAKGFRRVAQLPKWEQRAALAVPAAAPFVPVVGIAMEGPPPEKPPVPAGPAPTPPGGG